ncbi:hypothetical protein BRUCa_2708 [Brucella melitensis]|nr:hypothetical protein BM28_B0535 [Brucella melitensis M28]ADZ88652.1 hypothetical protein BM590_B0535 [Brucella melitensis M5-90]
MDGAFAVSQRFENAAKENAGAMRPGFQDRLKQAYSASSAGAALSWP